MNLFEDIDINDNISENINNKIKIQLINDLITLYKNHLKKYLEIYYKRELYIDIKQDKNDYIFSYYNRLLSRFNINDNDIDLIIYITDYDVKDPINYYIFDIIKILIEKYDISIINKIIFSYGKKEIDFYGPILSFSKNNLLDSNIIEKMPQLYITNNIIYSSWYVDTSCDKEKDLIHYKRLYYIPLTKCYINNISFENLNTFTKFIDKLIDNYKQFNNSDFIIRFNEYSIINDKPLIYYFIKYKSSNILFNKMKEIEYNGKLYYELKYDMIYGFI